MRKVINIIFIMLICLFPYRIFALEGSIHLECSPSTVTSGSSVTCTISGNASDRIKEVNANITVSTGLSISEYTLSSGWGGNDFGTAGNYKISSMNTATVSGDFTLGDLKIDVSNSATNGNFNITLSSVNFVDAVGSSTSISDASATITVNNGESTKGLKNLSVPGYTISPNFSVSLYDYTVVIDSATFKVNAEVANSSDTVKIVNEKDQSKTLDPNNITYDPNNGNMALIITVGDGGDGNVYQLIVTRKTDNENNTLASLTIGGVRVPLKSGVYDYEVYLDDISSYQVVATLTDPDNYELDPDNGGSGVWHGSNIPIIVRPKDSSSGLESRTYSINVIKNTSTDSGNSGNNNDKEEVITNPQTGNISIFIISLILIASLIISLYMYKKNMSYYQ